MWKSWFLARRLQTQLLVWTALILIASVVITFELRTQLNLRNLERNLRDRSETLLRALDRSLMLATIEVPLSAWEGRLRELVEADRTLTRLDIVANENGILKVAVSSSASPDLLVRSVPPAVTTEIRGTAEGRELLTIHPVIGTPYSMVAVSSMEFVDGYREINRTLEPLFGGILVVVVISLMHIMYQRTVSRRFDDLLEGIRHAGDRRLPQEIPVKRQDEIGIIAKTLNNLLAQVHSFNDELQREVKNATEVLNRRNLELEETTRQMLLMQRQLLQAERLATTGQMAATFAHEIGSPMSSLSAHVQLLLEDPGCSADQRETLTIIREQIQSMVQIVNDLLRSARRGPADFVPSDVNEILETVLRLVHPKLMSQRIAVTTELGKMPKVRAYPLYLQEAFLNLINNASDAMPGGGDLQLKTWYDPVEGLVHIQVSDSGPGIDPRVLEHVFDHFVTTKSIGSGTGLGLGIVREIVNGHRGNLHIGAANGSGTAVHLTFPPDSAGSRKA
jgi:signal transduction histidine kinase